MAYCNRTTLPPCNRLLERKWDEKKLQSHHDRLRTTRSLVDNKPPKDFVHIKQNRRKVQLEEDKLALIQRHNHQLLEKMNNIMHTTGRVDHRNMDWKPKRSLNQVKKQQEMDRLMRENHAMLRRIQYAKPQYNSQQWESDFKRHQSMSRNLSLIPIVKARRSQTLPCEMSLTSKGSFELPPIVQHTSRPETDYVRGYNLVLLFNLN
jgi:hypothetical protein